MISNYKLDELTELELEELETYLENDSEYAAMLNFKSVKELDEVDLEDLINEYNNSQK